MPIWESTMSSVENKMLRRRLVGSYISTVISISLVLLLVGIASLLLVNAGSVSDYFKENMQVSVLLKTEVDDEGAQEFCSALDSLPFVKETRFVSKAQGTEEMKAMLGEDFLSVFESSPIPASVDLTLLPQYVSADSLAVVKTEIMKSPLVDEVAYQQSLIDALNANLGKIAGALGVFILLLLFISFVLINNTVRLNIFSHRFTVHTMRLVGATRGFIRRPFMVQAVFEGVIAAFIAICLLLGALLVVKNSFAQLFEIFQLKLLLLVMGIVLVSGVAICVISTYFVVNKMVSLSRGELYY